MRRWRCALAVAALALAAVSVRADPRLLGGFAGSVDLPAGWHAVSGTDRFASRTGGAVLQVTVFPPNSFTNPREMAQTIEAELGAAGKGAPFTYSGRAAFMSDVSLESGTSALRGYLVAVLDAEHPVALIAFAPENSYNTVHDELLSALDSYSIDTAALLEPGPISQFYYPYPAPRRTPMRLAVGRNEYSAPVDVREIDASQTVIDRESRVLAENKSVNVDAWRRYYRMIFRDNYHRLDPYLPFVKNALAPGTSSDTQTAQALLSWMQGFLYERDGTLADLSSPLLSFVTQSGDCDSRTLLYSILLRHLGISAVLMVSSTYSHSMVGVLVNGQGARIAYEGRRYLVAELTARVPLGMIDSGMADPAGWVTVDLAPSSVAATLPRG